MVALDLPFRLVACDIDGTLGLNAASVSARTQLLLRQVDALGVTVVLVTARPPRSVRPLCARIGASSLAICANGALVYDAAAHTIIRSYPLDPAIARHIVSELRRVLPDIAFAVEVGLEFGHEPAYVPGDPPPPDALVAEAEELVGRPMAKLLARHPSHDNARLLEVARAVIGDLAPIHESGAPRLLEFSAPGVSKAVALEYLAGSLGVSREQVVAFGDMPNDIQMLSWAGTGVAVANAHADVIAVADDMCAACDDDGVASYLRRRLQNHLPKE